jgi:hypothetical protein
MYAHPASIEEDCAGEQTTKELIFGKSLLTSSSSEQ